MAEFITVRGNIFDSKAQMLVNPVNCVGVMGAGLAKQFKARYPEMFQEYREQCRLGLVRTGEVTLHPVRDGRTVANLPTKNDWRNPSQLEYADSGLLSLAHALSAGQFRSVAVPALGAGLGGLQWERVLPLIHDRLDLHLLRVEIYPPR